MTRQQDSTSRTRPGQVEIRIWAPVELVDGLKRLADEDDRKFSPYVRRVLKRHMDERTAA